jgi:hypothetical protein
MKNLRRWWVATPILALLMSAVPARAMDMVSACAQGCVGCCLLHRISILFAMLGGWN